ncbi:hypothetical protein HUS23_08925 [Ectothiorhodospiraceae bacterium 2226]|nr:hypothetical protein HUS23_08925 [Ectothiorhodospiraceae bacterium 2226]
MAMQRWVKPLELQLMLGLLGLIVVLLWAARALPALGTGYVVALWVLLGVPMLAILFRRRRAVRRAWLAVYLREDSPWQWRLRGGGLMLLGQVFVAAALSLALLLSLARGVPSASWIVLVLFVPVWVLGWRVLQRYLAVHAAPRLLPMATGGALRRVAGVALLLVLASWALWQPYADLGRVTLYEAVQFYAARQQAESGLLQHALEVTAALDGARHWLAQHWLEGLPGTALQVVAWLLVLVQEWLFVWPYLLLSQALTHVVYRHGYREFDTTAPAGP